MCVHVCVCVCVYARTCACVCVKCPRVFVVCDVLSLQAVLKHCCMAILQEHELGASWVQPAVCATLLQCEKETSGAVSSKDEVGTVQ